jgi:hypothetical protein
MTTNINIQSYHARIVSAYEAITLYHKSTNCNNQMVTHSLKKIVLYLQYVAPYLSNPNQNLYLKFIGQYGVVQAINNTAKRTGCVKPIPHLTTRTTLRKCLCGKQINNKDACVVSCSVCGLVYEFIDIADDVPVSKRPNKASIQRAQFRKQIDNVQAAYSTTPSDAIIERMRDELTGFKQIHVIRWLNDNKLKKHTPNVNYIVSCLTGYSPPQLTTDERADVIRLFDLVLYSLAEIAPNRSIAYRYLAFKLIEQVVDSGPRCDEMLASIHLPQTSTLISLDHMFYKVCKVNKFKYRPTLRRDRVDTD